MELSLCSRSVGAFTVPACASASGRGSPPCLLPRRCTAQPSPCQGRALPRHPTHSCTLLALSELGGEEGRKWRRRVGREGRGKRRSRPSYSSSSSSCSSAYSPAGADAGRDVGEGEGRRGERGRGARDEGLERKGEKGGVGGRSRRVCRVVDMSASLVPYETAWQWQKDQLARTQAHLPSQRDPHSLSSKNTRPSHSSQPAHGARDATAIGPLEQTPLSTPSHTRTSYGPDSVSHSENHANDSTLPDESSREPDVLLLMQHPPVYTLGAGSSLSHLKFPVGAPPAPLHFTERGGEVTYHGPGQLVVYPIIDLRRHNKDLHWYLRSLEEVIIRALDSAFGIQAERVDGMTGVWADGHKLAAIGVRVTRWVTYHGLALNVSTDLEAFTRIVPCGLTLPVGSVEQHLERRGCGGLAGEGHGSVAKGGSRVESGGKRSTEGVWEEWDECERRRWLMDEASKHLLAHFSSVFGFELVPAVGPCPK